MKVRVTWEFDVDTSDFDPKFIDIPGLATDLTKREIDFLLNGGLLDADDFEYSVVVE